MKTQSATEGMTEFQKFLFFSEKARELDTLKKYYTRLTRYTPLRLAAIRGVMRVSMKRWIAYLTGEQLLPDGFVEKFEHVFEKELAACLAKMDREQLDFIFPRSLLTKDYSKGGDEPHKATAELSSPKTALQ